MSDQSLDGRVVLITGGAGGLGRAMAVGLARAGARLGLIDVRADALEEAVAAVQEQTGSAEVVALPADIGDPAACEAAVAGALERFGDLYAIVNNAGLGLANVRRDYHRRPIELLEVSPELWERFVRVNATGAFLMLRAALPHLRRRGLGRIVNVTTSLDSMLRQGFFPYGASKAALEAASAIWSKELDGSGITLNVLVPGGPTDTPMVPAESGFDRQRLIRPEVVVGPLQWLLSDAAAGVNGRRFVGLLWDPALPADQAAERAGAPIGWPEAGTRGVWPT